MIGVVDYGGANHASVINAVDNLGFDYFISDNQKSLDDAEKIILPGVGAAPNVMQQLQNKGLDTYLKLTRKPILGICIGMQIMYETSSEGNTDGLSIFDGKVKKFEPRTDKPVPHMGWNEVRFDKTYSDLNGYYYFANSYYADISEQTTAISSYGDKFSAMTSVKNFTGVQFHPEKSGSLGYQFLQRFLSS